MTKKFNTKKKSLFEIFSFTFLFLVFLSPITANINLHGIGFGVEDNAKDAINFLKENNIAGPLYNNYDIGNYLDYQLYPKEKVFADARPEAYPKDFFQNTYFPMQQSEERFKTESNNYKFNVLFLLHTDTTQETTQLLAQLVKSNDWKMVYLNNSIVIFLKNNDANKIIIQKYAIDQKNLKLNKTDLDTKKKVGQLVNFFRAVGWENQWLAMNIRYLEYEPDNCAALQNVAYILQKHNDPQAPVHITKYMQTCMH